MISEKGIYGLISGVISTAILQPFENIKMALILPPKALSVKYSSNFILNFKEASAFILKEEGYQGFYKGLVAGTMKAGLGCYIYFTFLRHFQKENQSPFNNFVLSCLARTTSAILTNPLSIIQTRFQLADFHLYKNVRGAIKDIYVKEGFVGFFSGTLTCCIKEGIFAGIYYMLYEQLKQLGLNRFYSGIVSGMISTAVTHPFEIIRARLQTLGLTEKHQLSEHLIYRQFRVLYGSGEWLKGLTPRLLKKPIANTLTFWMFEAIEELKKKSMIENQI